MSLTAGTKLGAYDIISPLGAGGMGEVYRATDTRLKRDVAIKVLPDLFADDPDRLARFQREAELLASLNHPNIAAIYGLEKADGLTGIVLELVEGDTLADVIARGPMAVSDALPIARQVTEALEAAHERGVIHRDLKPANIKVTPDGRVKVLDFGLAKLVEPPATASSLSMSPTLSVHATYAGVILGTAAYMSPEQARGKAVDRRTDIWAFGCVFFEMLTGVQAFDAGDTVSDAVASILKSNPDLSRVPSEMRRLITACLAKDPRQRLQAIGDAWLLLSEEPAVKTTRALSLPWMMATATLALLAALSLWAAWRRTPPVQRSLMRLDVSLGPDAITDASSTLAISPDGRRIVFPVRGADGKRQLATRSLEQALISMLPGTEDGSDPFFSPDSQWVGFFAAGKLKKISVQGGAPVTLCEALTPRGASWGEDGTIVAGLRNTAGLVRVPADGGPPVPITQLMPGEATHRWPQILPGNDAVLFTASPSAVAYEEATIDVFSSRTRTTKILVQGGYFGRYLPVDQSIGYVVYIREGTLFAAPFDPVRLELRGAALPLLEDVASSSGLGIGRFAFSATGMFVYSAGKGSGQSWTVAWLNNRGRTEPLLAKPGAYDTPRLSPDGRRLALQVTIGRSRDLYVYDLQRDTLSRLTFTGGASPVWAADGKHLVFSTRNSLWWIRVDGSGEPQLLIEGKTPLNAYSFSPDSRYLAYFVTTAETQNDVWTVSVDMADSEHPKLGHPEVFLKTMFTELEPAFSPDGRWIAYRSNESGTVELYVRPFRGAAKWQISSGGVMHPRWSPAGRQLFWETLDGHIMVADYTVQDDAFVASRPRLWTETRILAPSGAYNLDVAPDGKRFVVFPEPDVTAADKGPVHVTFLINFFDELRRRMPLK